MGCEAKRNATSIVETIGKLPDTSDANGNDVNMRDAKLLNVGWNMKFQVTDDWGLEIDTFFQRRKKGFWFRIVCGNWAR